MNVDSVPNLFLCGFFLFSFFFHFYKTTILLLSVHPLQCKFSLFLKKAGLASRDIVH